MPLGRSSEIGLRIQLLEGMRSRDVTSSWDLLLRSWAHGDCGGAGRSFAVILRDGDDRFLRPGGMGPCARDDDGNVAAAGWQWKADLAQFRIERKSLVVSSMCERNAFRLRLLDQI